MNFGVKRYVGRAIVKNTGFGRNFGRIFVQVGPQSGPKTPQERPQTGKRATKRGFEKHIEKTCVFRPPRAPQNFGLSCRWLLLAVGF